MNKINVYYPNHKSFEINSFNDGIEYNVWIKIRLKRCEIHNCCNKNLLYLIFAFSILFCVSLIFFRNYEKTQYFLDLFSEGKIYYKNDGYNKHATKSKKLVHPNTFLIINKSIALSKQPDQS